MKKNTDINKIRKKAGSLTIEASLVMPLFMFMMICVISLSSLLLFQLRLKESLHEEVKVIAMKSISEGYPDENEVKKVIEASVGDYILRIAPIENGSDGLEIKESVTKDEVISISASYKAKLYYDLFHLFDKQFTQRCVQHNWEGYIRGYYEETGKKEEEYVYVTDDSEVYHLNKDCSHIKLNIMTITAEELNNVRNSDGGKYKNCEHCHSKKTDNMLYITSDGNKFHNSLSCSGLKRTIIAVPMSEVKNKRPCSRCGK